nr:helix-turn-helix transcriptional regulator [uncultured Oscillibacter sp.]
MVEIGSKIRKLRSQREISQERFASDIGVSVQTISRWENNVNSPDLSMLPILAAYFKVTTDYLLGVKGESHMAKLLKTVETFEVSGKNEADRLIAEFQSASFPKMISARVDSQGDITTLTVEKEFGVVLDDLKFEK